MKKIILGVAIAIAFPSVAFAAEGAKSECKCKCCKDMKDCTCCPKDGKPEEQDHKH